MKKSGIVFCLFLAVILVFGSLKVFAAPNYSYKVYTPSPYVQNNTVNAASADVIELVVDYSGSMGKWTLLTERLMNTILPQIPAKTRVGFRAFGHIQRLSDAEITSTMKKYPGSLAQSLSTYKTNGICSPIGQIARLEPNNTKAIIAGMGLITDGGDTPLTKSLEQVVYKDFLGLDINIKKKIILITDGGETCFGNPCAFVRKLVQTRKDIQIDVILVGGGNMQCLSTETGGLYKKIKSNDDFIQALNNSFNTKPAAIPENDFSKPQYEFMD